MSPVPVIEAAGLTKRYGGGTAVQGLDLSVERGRIYGFLGPNGAGKTTTMRMLTGLTRPTDGSATVAGVDVRERDRLGEHIGYVPDTPPLYEKLTAREQLAAVADVRGLDPELKRERIDRLLDRFGLGAADDRIETYSRGMKQKTSVVQTIVHEPDVVFLDEPTNGLDPNAARTLKTVLGELRDAGTTVFLSTHVLPVVDELADTVGLLYDGELLAEDDPESLKADLAGDTLEDAFVELTTSDGAALGESGPGVDTGGPSVDDRRPVTDGDGERRTDR
jgi:ABC-2 type transport system ATP-binding protein